MGVCIFAEHFLLLQYWNCTVTKNGNANQIRYESRHVMTMTHRCHSLLAIVTISTCCHNAHQHCHKQITHCHSAHQHCHIAHPRCHKQITCCHSAHQQCDIACHCCDNEVADIRDMLLTVSARKHSPWREWTRTDIWPRPRVWLLKEEATCQRVSGLLGVGGLAYEVVVLWLAK